MHFTWQLSVGGVKTFQSAETLAFQGAPFSEAQGPRGQEEYFQPHPLLPYFFSSEVMNCRGGGHVSQSPAPPPPPGLPPHTKAQPTTWWLGFEAGEHGPRGMSSSRKHMETIPILKASLVSLLHVSWFFSCNYNFCSTPTPAQMVFIRTHCFWGKKKTQNPTLYLN